jgi:hypothetical protein
MNDDDAFRDRLAAITPEQVAALYDATADDWAALGVTREVFTHNMAVNAGYEAEIGPYQVVLEAYLAMADPSIRDAAQNYQRGLDALHAPADRRRPMGDIRKDGDRLRQIFDDAIANSGDARLVEAKRLYDRSVVAASDRYARRLR